MDKPSIGRIVHFVDQDSRHIAAIVGEVKTGDIVGLQCFAPYATNGDWMPDVKHDEGKLPNFLAPQPDAIDGRLHRPDVRRGRLDERCDLGDTNSAGARQLMAKKASRFVSWPRDHQPIETPADIQAAYERGWMGVVENHEAREAFPELLKKTSGYATLEDAAHANGWAGSGGKEACVSVHMPPADLATIVGLVKRSRMVVVSR